MLELGRVAGLRLPFMACDVELSSFILSPRDDLYEGTELSRECSIFRGVTCDCHSSFWLAVRGDRALGAH